MPVIELRQRWRGYTDLGQQQQQYHQNDYGDDKGGFGTGGYPGGAGGGPTWPPHASIGRAGRSPPYGGGGNELEEDGSDDDFGSSGDPWRRFRKTSRERLLRGFSPLRRTVAEAAHHPAAPKVYRFLFFFSLAGVLYLLSVARVLLSGSPFTNVRAKEGGLTQQEMGWAVVEAASMYAFVMVISGYAWYRHTRRRAQVGGVMYTRLRDRGADHPALYDPRLAATPDTW